MSWTSIEVIDKFEIKIPENLKKVCSYMGTQLTTEYAILTNIESINEDKITLKNEFYIPKQSVSYSFIKIDSSDINVKNYDTIIHRHPNGCHYFSTTDNEHINLNFKVSILFTKEKNFIKGIYNLPVGKRKFFQIENDFEIISNDIEIDEMAIDTAILENIIIDEYKYLDKYESNPYEPYEPFKSRYNDGYGYDLFTRYDFDDKKLPDFNTEEKTKPDEINDLNERIDVMETRIEEIYDIVVELKETFSLDTKKTIADNVEDIKMSIEKYSDDVESSINEIKDMIGMSYETLNKKED